MWLTSIPRRKRNDYQSFLLVLKKHWSYSKNVEFSPGSWNVNILGQSPSNSRPKVLIEKLPQGQLCAGGAGWWGCMSCATPQCPYRVEWKCSQSWSLIRDEAGLEALPMREEGSIFGWLVGFLGLVFFFPAPYFPQDSRPVSKVSVTNPPFFWKTLFPLATCIPSDQRDLLS